MSTPAPGPDPEAGSVSTAQIAQPAARRLARSAGVIGIATMTSRVLGLVRDQVMAYLFGAGNAVDAYNVAFRIPNLVRDLFAEGAMSAAFVPTFTRYLTREGPHRCMAAGQPRRQRAAHRHGARWCAQGSSSRSRS